MAGVAFKGYWSTGSGVSSTYASMSLTEAFDSNAFHDNSTNPTRVTIPVTGWYLFLAEGYVQTKGANSLIRILVDGTTGYAENSASTANTDLLPNLMHVIFLCAGQYVEVQVKYSVANTGYSGGGLTCLQLPTPVFVGNAPSGASAGAIPWSSLLDEDGYYDVGNPTRFTAPADGNYLYAVRSGLGILPVVEVKRNGTTVQASSAPGSNSYAPCIGISAMTSGQYLEAVCDVATNTEGQLVAFSLDGVDCAMAEQSSGTSIPAGGTSTAVTFNSEEVDTAGFHDNSTNNTRVTAPATRPYWLVSASRIDGVFVTDHRLFKNGSDRANFGGISRIRSTANQSAVVSMVDALTSGDYYEQRLFHDGAGANTTLTDGTKFSIVDLDDLAYGSYPCPGDFTPQIWRYR